MRVTYSQALSVFTFFNFALMATNLRADDLGARGSLDQSRSVAGPSWQRTGSMRFARRNDTATLLPNGKVLFAGGAGLTADQTSAEIYDPPTSTFRATGSLVTGRSYHTATLLPSGKVLIVGGDGVGNYLASAELYDPPSGTFSRTGSLATARMYHTATLLPSGKVLIAGGTGANGWALNGELYDPLTETFSGTGSVTTPREEHTATLLPSGKVLIVGGDYSYGEPSAELYDPLTGTFSSTGSLQTGRFSHTATLLPSGKVLVAGGYKYLLGGDGYLSSVEIYDPLTGSFSSAGSLQTGRYYHTATLLPSGEIMVAGGFNADNGWDYLASTEIYDPMTGKFGSTVPMATGRVSHTATLLPSGDVLVAGGGSSQSTFYLRSAELFTPGS